MNPQPVDLVIRQARLLVCFDDAGTELPDGWLAIDRGVIVAIGDQATRRPRPGPWWTPAAAWCCPGW